ncbi:MAG: lipid-A-disaccharide synthase [Lysobacterales bacterium]
MSRSAPRIALVAGEASGDQLGAGLIQALRERYPGATFAGIGGTQMKAAGMDAWWDSEELAVMGLVEVVSHFPRLLALRSKLVRRLKARPPDVFVGIDAPDFNLGLEIKLRRAGVRTVHYVSPTVWAWRKRRVKKIARAADCVLCLFPFEPDFYADHDVSARYVGHPMADRIVADEDPAAARKALGMDPYRTTLALLPGSRASEVGRLAGPMLDAARLLREQRPHMQFAAAMANTTAESLFRSAMAERGFAEVTLVRQNARQTIAAADAVLCASGTATLETLLVNRPLVMVYRLAPSTYHLARRLHLIKLRHFSLPNILAGEALVPELIQQEATGERMAEAVCEWLGHPGRCAAVKERFLALHEQLRCDADARAAESVAELVERGGA